MSLLLSPPGTLLFGADVPAITTTPASAGGWPGLPSGVIPGGPISGAVAKLAGKEVNKLLGDWVGVRGITALLGLLLIAAAIFTHPTVINVGKTVGKVAAAA